MSGIHLVQPSDGWERLDAPARGNSDAVRYIDGFSAELGHEHRRANAADENASHTLVRGSSHAPATASTTPGINGAAVMREGSQADIDPYPVERTIGQVGIIASVGFMFGTLIPAVQIPCVIAAGICIVPAVITCVRDFFRVARGEPTLVNY